MKENTIGIETVGMTMRFDKLLALDNVSLRVRPGSLHALLGENGAGKSTLVKCIMGFYQATAGQLLLDNREVKTSGPKAALGYGLGMVYQHFTLVPSLTGYENLLISRADVPSVVNWKKECADINLFMQQMPFDLPLKQQVQNLSAGEKQKLEIIKQLYLGCRFLILDEPTSVLTPLEADEVLTHIQHLCQTGEISVLMITHKFREVMAYADHVSVLRSGQLVGEGAVHDLSQKDLARMMVGEGTQNQHTAGENLADITAPDSQQSNPPSVCTATDTPVLSLSKVRVQGRFGEDRIAVDELHVNAGEIVGIAGVSGNGQTELMEALCGQRKLQSGKVVVNGQPFSGSRADCNKGHIRFLPEEPLKNACAPSMSVSDNMAFRIFDQPAEKTKRFWLSRGMQGRHAVRLIKEFKVKAGSVDAPIRTLSGGNVQRAVLARELSGTVNLLIISNPCFGLDFSAVTEIRQRITQAKNAGTAVLLLSEDLDEILELADRVTVMSAGRIAYNVPAARADRAEIGRAMGGH